MTPDYNVVLQELADMRKLQHEDHKTVLAGIAALAESFADMKANGCGQAWQHIAHAKLLSEHGADIVSLKESRAEARGRGTVLAAAVSAGVSLLVGVLVALFKGSK